MLFALTGTPDPGGDPLRTVYAVTTEADLGHTLSQRIRRRAEELEDSDARLLTLLLQILPESES